jgi:hypothetical protein
MALDAAEVTSESADSVADNTADIETSVDAPAASDGALDDIASQFDAAFTDASASGEDTSPGPAATGERPAAPAGSPQQQQLTTNPLSQYTQEDFRYAQALGVSAQDLAGMNPNAFRQMVNNVGRILQQQQQQRAQPPAQQQAYQYSGFQPYKLPGDETMYDDGIRNAVSHFNQHFQGLHGFYQQQFQQIQPVLAQFQQHLPYITEMRERAKRDADQSFYDRFDQVLDQYDESLVGRGKFSALQDQSHKAARKQVANQVQKELDYYARSGEAMPPIEDVVDRAFHGLFYKQIQERQKAVVKDRLNNRLSQTTATPSRAAQSLAPRVGVAELARQFDKVLR